MAKIRAIDQGTVYDKTGRMRKLVRDIESGKHGAVTDIVCCIAHRDHNGRGIGVTAFHFGPGGAPTAHWILSTAKNSLEPA